MDKVRYPITVKGGQLVDASGKPVRLQTQHKPDGRGMGYSRRKLATKFNPRMVTSDFDGRDE